MNISEILDAKAISIRPRSTKKLDLIREMVDLLARTKRLQSPQKALADVIEREKEKGTGLELGVAVPHCRSEGTGSLAAAFALVPDGIDFGALDGNLSRFIFLLISPKNATTTHVQALATMARVLKQAPVQEALLTADTPQEVEDILLGAQP